MSDVEYPEEFPDALTYDVAIKETFEEPCNCEQCGKIFELKEGNGCFDCNTIFCAECQLSDQELCCFCKINK